MARPSGNRLLPVIAIVAVLIAGFIVIKQMKGSGSGVAGPTPIPAVRAPDADTSADTLRTISAQLADIRRRNDELVTENDRLRRNEEARTNQVASLTQQVTSLRSGVDALRDNPQVNNLRRQIAELRTQAANMAANSPGLRSVQKRIDELEQQLKSLVGLDGGAEGPPPAQPPAATATGSGNNNRLAEIVGPGPGGYRPGASAPPAEGAAGHGLLDPAAALRTLGIDGGLPAGRPVPAGTPTGKPADGLVWHTALDAGAGTQAQPEAAMYPWLDTRDLSAGAAAGVAALKPSPVPVYTIPAWGTGLDATAMTALIGRISTRQGQLTDPYPFKVLVGPDNLAANGLTIPGLTGMVLAGYAAGDWTLACVRGTITGATFVFDDGVIISYPQGNAVGPDEQQQGGSNRKELGTIADAQGVPCVSGKRITNAPSYLADRIGMIAAGGAAQAYADAQTTTTSGSSAFGTTESTDVTGSVGKYVLGNTIRDSVAEVGKWLGERQSQSYDAIYVRPGARVSIHFSTEIRIDRVPDARRLAYPQTGGDLHGTLD